MPTETRVVDNRTFLLGLDELYRGAMKRHEREELLAAARVVSEALDIGPANVPVEGYYSEEESLKEYFLRMRALQNTPDTLRDRVQDLPEFERLVAVASAPLFGLPTANRKLLPAGRDPLTIALAAEFPSWSVEHLTDVAHRVVIDGDDISLVGLAAMAKDSVILAALRETAVLYAMAVAGCAPGEPVTIVYEWRVDTALTERARRFVTTFNALFNERLPEPGPDQAERFWSAAHTANIVGRCVRLGWDDTVTPWRQYHWAVVPSPEGMRVHDFWSDEVWTTERFGDVLSDGKLP